MRLRPADGPEYRNNDLSASVREDFECCFDDLRPRLLDLEAYPYLEPGKPDSGIDLSFTIEHSICAKGVVDRLFSRICDDEPDRDRPHVRIGTAGSVSANITACVRRTLVPPAPLRRHWPRRRERAPEVGLTRLPILDCFGAEFSGGLISSAYWRWLCSRTSFMHSASSAANGVLDVDRRDLARQVPRYERGRRLLDDRCLLGHRRENVAPQEPDRRAVRADRAGKRRSSERSAGPASSQRRPRKE
jgi:hypothetical protein